LHALREEENLEALDIAGRGVETGDDIVTELLGLLFGIRRSGRQIEDVRLTVVLNG